MSGEVIQVVYRVHVAEASLEERIEALLLEQTVELPRTALPTDFVRANIVGTVLGMERIAQDEYRVTLAQPLVAAAADPAQLLNVLFGNCSLQPEIRLEDLHLPDSLATKLGGPRFGIAGLRGAAGVSGRALTASVLKPMGLSISESASLCHTLALSGLDIIKDDHGMADHEFNRFAGRVEACVAATRKASQETGRKALYVPNLVGTPSAVMHQAWQARHLGAEAVMVSPMLVGLPFLKELADEIGLPILAHPAFCGSLRIAPQALLGKIFRLFGADAVIFPNVGGRFSYSREECEGIAKALRAPCAVAPSFPTPAGGMRVESLDSVLQSYGADTILLVGGSLLESPDKAALLDRARRFVAAVHAYSAP